MCNVKFIKTIPESEKSEKVHKTKLIKNVIGSAMSYIKFVLEEMAFTVNSIKSLETFWY